MSTAVKAIDGMSYERTAVKAPNGGALARKALKKLVNDQNTFYTLWCVVVKHKMPLLVAGNVILVLNWAFPQWFEVVKALASNL